MPQKKEIELLIHRATLLKEKNPAQALALLDDAILRSEKITEHKLIATAKIEKAFCFSNQKNFKSALTNFQEALSYFKSINNYQGIISCLSHKAKLYIRLGDSPHAIELLIERLKHCRLHHDEPRYAENLDDLGKIFTSHSFII